MWFEQDPAEVSELVAEIEEIDKERKEVNRRICGLVTKVTGLFCSTSHLRYREVSILQMIIISIYLSDVLPIFEGSFLF